MAMQGLAVVPLFAGYDLDAADRRRPAIFSYDVTGGRYEEHDYHSVGSGSVFARGALKKLCARPRPRTTPSASPSRRCTTPPTTTPPPAARPDPRHLPGRRVVTADGYRRVADDELGAVVRGDRRADRVERPGADRTRRRADRRSRRRSQRMSMPFYVSPEQIMQDRADYARKGIARGRSVVVLTYADGMLFVAENPSRALHKVSEIYDRIAFAAVGKYNEFENLRVAGVRLADLRGYSYDRRDVTGRGLANAYAQTLGTIFTEQQKPYEVEIVVAEVGRRAEDDQIYRLTYDGSVADEHGFVAMGGSGRGDHRRPAPSATATGMTLDEALTLAVDLLGGEGDGAPRARGRPARGRGARPRPAAPRVRPDHRRRRLAGPAAASADRIRGHDPRGRRRGPARVAARPRPTSTVACEPRTRRTTDRRSIGSTMDRRIFGIENEYGVTCTFQGQRRLSPDEVARYLFRRVVSWGR